MNSLVCTVCVCICETNEETPHDSTMGGIDELIGPLLHNQIHDIYSGTRL